MAQQQYNNGFFPLKPSDLTDPTLFKLNNDFDFIYSKVGAFFSPGSTPTFPSSPTFVNLKLSGQTTVPTDPTTVLTLASANLLFAPSAQRPALLSGSYPAGGQAVQPLPSGSGGTNSYFQSFTSQTTVVVGHGAGTLNVHVQVRNAASPPQLLLSGITSITFTDLNTVTIVFSGSTSGTVVVLW